MIDDFDKILITDGSKNYCKTYKPHNDFEVVQAKYNTKYLPKIIDLEKKIETQKELEKKRIDTLQKLV